jgi:hypothetical protein
MEAEGWYHDPYERHDERWYSNGKPTALVRDAKVESKDPPPSDPPPSGTLVRSDGDLSAAGPEDLRRADDAERGDMNPDYGERAFDNFGYAQTPFEPYRQDDRP